MIFPERVLGNCSVKRRSSGRASDPISFATQARSSSFSSGDGWWPCSRVTKAEMAWPFGSSGGRRLRLFGDFFVSDERGLDLHRAETMAADVDDIVDAAHEPVVAVGIHARAVAGEVAAGDVGPV